MTSEVAIRLADEADLDALSGLRTRWAGVAAGDRGFAKDLAAWLSAERERRTIWLAIASDDAVGMVSLFEYRRMPKPGRLGGRWGYLGNLFVVEGFRNRGVGSALVAAVAAESDARGYDRLVVSPSEEGVSLFGRAGFVIPGTVRADPLLVRPGRDR